MKYLLWDFDGTLGYRTGGWSAACAEVLERAEVASEIDGADVRPLLQDGFPWHTPEEPHTHISTAEEWWEELYPVFGRALEANGVDPSRAGELAERVRRTYVGSGWERFDDAKPTLSELSSEGWDHVVLSNHVPELASILRDLGLDGHFEEVYTSAEIGYEKPHPEAFRTAVAPLEDDATVWMIGDSLRADVRGARSTGLPAILVRDSHPDAEYAAGNLSEIADVLGDG